MIKFLFTLFTFISLFGLGFSSFTLSGSLITQSGTDTDLSGLSAIAGVTTSTSGSGVDEYTIYNLNNLGLSITGTLTQNPEQEMILFNSPSNPIVAIKNGGVYNFGIDVSNNGFIRQTEGIGIFVGSRNPGCCGTGQAVVSIEDGGTWNWKGATLDVGQLPWFAAVTSIVNITNGVLLVRRDATSDVVQVRQSSDNFYVDGLSFIGNTKGDITFLRRPQEMLNYNPQTTGGAIAFSSSTPNYDVTFRGYSGGDKGNAQDIKLWEGSRPILINSKTGSELILGNHQSGNVNGYGVALVYQEFDLNIKDLVNNPIADVRFFVRDTDNLGREIYNRESYVVNNTLDNIYTGLSQVNGSITTQNILLASNVANVGDISGFNVGNYAWDYRGKNNDDSDLFDTHLWSYNYQYQLLPDIEMKGIVPVSIDTKLYVDQSISESDSAVVSAYTKIDTLDKLYDRAKLWKIQLANIEYPLISEILVDVDGTALNLGEYNLIVNTTGSTAFEVNTTSKEILIKTDNFFIGSKFTSVGPISQFFLDSSVLTNLDLGEVIPVNLSISGLPTVAGSDSLCKFIDNYDNSETIIFADVNGEIMYSTFSEHSISYVCDSVGYVRGDLEIVNMGTIQKDVVTSLDTYKDKLGIKLYGSGIASQKALVTYSELDNIFYIDYSSTHPIVTYESFFDKVDEIFSSSTGINYYPGEFDFTAGRFKIDSGSTLRLSPLSGAISDPEIDFISYVSGDSNPNTPYLSLEGRIIIRPIVDYSFERDLDSNYNFLIDEFKVFNVALNDSDVLLLYKDQLRALELSVTVTNYNSTSGDLDFNVTLPFIEENKDLICDFYYSKK